MGGQDDGTAPALEGEQELAEPLAALAVEPGEGLVEEQQTGASEGDPRQADPPLHAGGEGTCALVGHGLELYLRERRQEPSLRSVVAPHGRPEAQVLERAQVLVHVGAVGHHGDGFADGLGAAESIDSGHRERARGGADERREDPEERGLSGAVGSEQDETGPGWHLERHAVDHGRSREGLPETDGGDHLIS